jgi:hypothetical protein
MGTTTIRALLANLPSEQGGWVLPAVGRGQAN